MWFSEFCWLSKNFGERYVWDSIVLYYFGRFLLNSFESGEKTTKRNSHVSTSLLLAFPDKTFLSDGRLCSVIELTCFSGSQTCHNQPLRKFNKRENMWTLIYQTINMGNEHFWTTIDKLIYFRNFHFIHVLIGIPSHVLFMNYEEAASC